MPMATRLPNLPELRNALQDAVIKCSERCLFNAAKWAAEALTSMKPPVQGEAATPYSLPSSSRIPQQAALEASETHLFLLAKTYFDCHEYDRAAACLAECKSSKARFLRLYSQYIAGEKRKDEESEMILGPLDGAVTGNHQVSNILQELEGIFAEQKNFPKDCNEDDSYLLYLYGIVLDKQKNEKQARGALVTSVTLYPYNWSAWQQLGASISSIGELNNLIQELPDNIMTNMFVLHTNQELYQTTASVHQQVTDLLSVFPSSSWLLTERALLYYHARQFEEAEQIFDTLIKRDPNRLENLDQYSNVLYVMEKRPKLGFIAQLATQTDKFRPETCCVVGNYYSLTSEHEKAVMYFRRALTLDRSFLSAWTLMGHEYVEMKNTHAAIEAYRRAVDVNRKDYRAWYGLGLSYEVLEMHYYALFYFQRAAALRPYDPQMWQAMAACFDRKNQPGEAIKAYKRALVVPQAAGNKDLPVFNGHVSYQIGLMYEKMRDLKEAAKWMELVMREEDYSGITPNTSKSKMWLARYAFARGEWERAMSLAQELCEDGVEVEEAKAIVRDIRARREERK